MAMSVNRDRLLELFAPQLPDYMFAAQFLGGANRSRFPLAGDELAGARQCACANGEEREQQTASDRFVKCQRQGRFSSSSVKAAHVPPPKGRGTVIPNHATGNARRRLITMEFNFKLLAVKRDKMSALFQIIEYGSIRNN